jgi:hypothetical protein
MREMVRATDPSTLALPTVWVSVSTVNQATRGSDSMAAAARRGLRASW